MWIKLTDDNQERIEKIIKTNGSFTVKAKKIGETANDLISIAFKMSKQIAEETKGENDGRERTSPESVG